MNDSPDPEHTIELRVRYAETDAQGFVHHSNYIVYCEEARTELFRVQGGSYREMEEMGYLFVVARFELQYHRPARYDDLLSVTVRESKRSSARLEHEYRFTRNGELICLARSVLACTNREGKVQRLSDVLDRVMNSPQGGV